MVSLQLHDQLLQFPLFLGMSRDDLNQIAGHTRFDFQKHPSRTELIKDGTPCSQLCFLLSGTVSAEGRSDDGSYRLVEQIAAPVVVEPEVIFGYRQRYTHTYRSVGDVSLLRLDRAEVVRLSQEFLIFRINLLNLLATQAQKLQHQPWRRRPGSLRERVIRFVAERCLRPAGPKTLHILMTQLAEEVGDSRLEVSRTLNRLQDEGLITLHRGRIEIPQMELLLQ